MLFWFLMVLPFARVRAQQFEFSKELRFAQYLQDKEAGPEAIRVLEQIDTMTLSRAQKDSLFLCWDGPPTVAGSWTGASALF